MARSPCVASFGTLRRRASRVRHYGWMSPNSRITLDVPSAAASDRQLNPSSRALFRRLAPANCHEPDVAAGSVPQRTG